MSGDVCSRHLKMGDVELGRKVFIQKCAHCHNDVAGGKHKQGPNLFGLVGSKTGQSPGYSYTEANRNRGRQDTPRLVYMARFTDMISS